MENRTKRKKIGEILFQLRKKETITKECLCLGLCSLKTLDRIEKGIGKPDRWLIEALFSRLGKLITPLEYYMSRKEYELQEIRINIRKAYREKEKTRMLCLLNCYKHQIGIQSPLHQQFILYTKAMLYENYDEMNKRIKLLKQALLCTIPNFSNENYKQFYFSSEELHLLLCLSNTYEAVKNEEKAFQIRQYCYSYLWKSHIEEEMRLAYLPPLAICFAEQIWSKKNFVLLQKISNQMIELLQNNEKLFTLSEMMTYQAKAKQMEKYSFEKEIFFNHSLLYASLLSNILQEYKNPKVSFEKCFSSELIGLKLMEQNQSDCHLIGDDIRVRRKLQQITQQKLCKNLCSIQTLSNIETGKSFPQKELYLNLMKRLGVTNFLYENFVDTSNFSISEKRFQIEKFIDHKKYDEAEELLDELEEEFTKENNNLQYQILMRTRLDVHLYQLDPALALKKIEKALSYSLPNYKNQELELWCLSRNETKLLIQIAFLYGEMDKMEESIYILSKIQAHYENGSINIQYHLYEYEMVLNNLGNYLGKTGRHEKAIELLEKLIYLSADYGDGNMLSASLYAKAWNMEKIIDQKSKTFDISTCKKTLMQAFCVNIATNNFMMKEYLAEHYRHRYGIELKIIDLSSFYNKL